MALAVAVLREGPADMWIKICGLTTADAVAAALDAGVDAIGFVFARSVRQVTPSQALELAAPARGRVLCVAVTRHPSQQDIDQVIATFEPDLLQTDAADFEALQLPTQLVRLPVFRGEPADASATLPARILFEGATSGAGALSDWTVARKIARRTELVLAGGLNPANVSAAVESVRPFGVDVSTGVEARPGMKSPVEIENFVRAVRSARAEV
jgi:phosphoribosylanthranilate isomerase